MTIPRQGSVDGEYGLPIIPLEVRKRIRITVDGDMPRGVAAWNADEGWADILARDENDTLQWADNGRFVTRRISGKVEVRWA